VRLIALLLFRVETGLAAIVVAILGWTVFGWEVALNAALTIMGAFILIQTLAAYLWARPYIGRPSPFPEAAGGDASANPYSDAAKVAITTQGVVLGLISFSNSSGLNLTLRVGAASLAGGVLIASALYLLVVQGPAPDRNRRFAASFLFTILLWALAFGLICVVAGNWVKS
jgi:hypothetical protein